MRIVIAEDAALIRAGLSEILTSAGHEITGEVCDATELENVMREHAETSSLPDLVVSDVRMPPTNADDGLEAAVRLVRSTLTSPSFFSPPISGGHTYEDSSRMKLRKGGSDTCSKNE